MKLPAHEMQLEGGLSCPTHDVDRAVWQEHEVPASSFHEALHRMWRTPEKLVGAVVLTIGLDDRRAARPIARISRGDGVRAELYFEEPDRLRWRTTYREFVRMRTAAQQISFLGDVPRPAPGLGRMSELCVVARRWWEAHAI